MSRRNLETVGEKNLTDTYQPDSPTWIHFLCRTTGLLAELLFHCFSLMGPIPRQLLGRVIHKWAQITETDPVHHVAFPMSSLEIFRQLTRSSLVVLAAPFNRN